MASERYSSPRLVQNSVEGGRVGREGGREGREGGKGGREGGRC